MKSITQSNSRLFAGIEYQKRNSALHVLDADGASDEIAATEAELENVPSESAPRRGFSERTTLRQDQIAERPDLNCASNVRGVVPR